MKQLAHRIKLMGLPKEEKRSVGNSNETEEKKPKIEEAAYGMASLSVSLSRTIVEKD